MWLMAILIITKLLRILHRLAYRHLNASVAAPEMVEKTENGLLARDYLLPWSCKVIYQSASNEIRHYQRAMHVLCAPWWPSRTNKCYEIGFSNYHRPCSLTRFCPLRLRLTTLQLRMICAHCAEAPQKSISGKEFFSCAKWKRRKINSFGVFIKYVLY